MFLSNGKYGTAKIFADAIEENASIQIYDLLFQDFVKNSQLRFMPNIQYDDNCPMGTTIAISDESFPNLLGQNVGSGAEIALIGEKDKNQIDTSKLKTLSDDYLIELAEADDELYLIVRSDGQVVENFREINKDFLKAKCQVLKAAESSRKAIISELADTLDFVIKDSFSTTSDYVDTEDMTLRKGAVSAKKGERTLIGNFICVGKGNADWNNSAPQNIDEQNLHLIQDTVEVVKTLKPIYNSKISI